jgi:hypothetical protein
MATILRHTIAVPQVNLNDDGTFTATPTTTINLPSAVGQAPTVPYYAQVDTKRENPLTNLSKANYDAGITFSIGGLPWGKKQSEGIQGGQVS